MRPDRLPLAPVLAGLLLALVWALRPPAGAPAPAETADEPAPAAGSAPGPRRREDFPPEEVFRRAFWRHPSPADRLLDAERVESADAAGEVRGWRWFLALHPSPALLAALRAPDTFGLRRLAADANAPAAPLVFEKPPSWFPARADPRDWEILQAPGGGMVALYRSSDNLLFATDRGTGFSPPARPL